MENINFPNKYINRNLIKFRNLCYMVVTNLLEIREGWLWYVILVCINPLTLLLFMGILVKDPSTETIKTFIIGNIINSLSTGTFLTLGQQFSYFKHNNALDYYLTLPIGKISIIIAYVIRNTVFMIPSTVIILMIGRLYYNVNFVININFIIAMLLSSFSLAGFGVIIGVYGKSIRMSSLLTQILQPIFIFLAPVYVTSDKLPKLINYISYIMPTRYAANALRNSLLQIGNVYIDILILLAITIISLILVTVKLDWNK